MVDLKEASHIPPVRLFLIIVLVIEHLVHGVSAEHQEGDVDVLANLAK